jgi:ferricrocin synthase
MRENANIIPPFRLNAYQGGNTSYMVFSIHHALYDGVSLPVILRTVVDIYLNIFVEKKESLSAFLHALTLSKKQNPIQFWKAYLEGVDSITPKHPATDKPINFSKKLTVSLSAAVKKAADSEVTLNALLCSLFGLSVAPEGANEVTLGVSVVLMKSTQTLTKYRSSALGERSQSQGLRMHRCLWSMFYL